MTFRPSPRFAAAFVALALILGPAAAHAVGGNDDDAANSPATMALYDAAKRDIDAGRYAAAVPTLEKLLKAEPRNANAWNLLAYSNRKLKNYDQAHKFYRTALSIDPEHRGAHEYLGELHLTQGNLKAAEDVRAKLSAICSGSCDELQDLDKAIMAFKSGAPTPAMGW